jgi:hypothetical protein
MGKQVRFFFTMFSTSVGAVAAFIIGFGAPMKILSIIEVKILASAHPLVMATSERRVLS